MLTQDYTLYTPVDQQTWHTLYNRQVKAVQEVAYKNFSHALNLLHLSNGQIPSFDNINEQLKHSTGWSIYAVPGLVENEFFFQQLLQKKFGATTWLRKPEQLDYLEEPDMFHDVFGHVPLLADECICRFFTALAQLAERSNYNAAVVEAIARLYWYTVEFGLIQENGALKIYGAGILSSIGETAYCLSGKVPLVPFDAETIINTPYIKDSYQSQYFVINSLAELEASVAVIEKQFENAYIEFVIKEV
jgi:phenylalanine-4-hydroxylase